MSRWSELAAAARNVFATPEFAETWLRHFGGEPDVVETERVVVPLVRERRGPLRLLRFVGHGPADELGPVCAPADRDEGRRLLNERLQRGGWDVFVGELLPGDGDWSGLGRAVGGDASPVLRFGTRDWDEYLATRSANFRQLVRRTLRKVESAGGTYRLADAASLERDLDTLLALHRERWAGRGTGFDRFERFHREFAALALERGWLRLWLLEVDGLPAAVWHGFRFAGVESYYQAGRARRFDELRPGLALLAHTVRAAQADGLDEYRFLRGDEPFKYRFTDDDPGLITVARARGALGAAALAGGRLTRALARRRRRSPRRPPPSA